MTLADRERQGDRLATLVCPRPDADASRRRDALAAAIDATLRGSMVALTSRERAAALACLLGASNAQVAQMFEHAPTTARDVITAASRLAGWTTRRNGALALLAATGWSTAVLMQRLLPENPSLGSRIAATLPPIDTPRHGSGVDASVRETIATALLEAFGNIRPRLSVRERAAAIGCLLGAANKDLALAFGHAPTTARDLVGQARRVLGWRSRHDGMRWLVATMGWSLDALVERALPGEPRLAARLAGVLSQDSDTGVRQARQVAR